MKSATAAATTTATTPSFEITTKSDLESYLSRYQPNSNISLQRLLFLSRRINRDNNIKSTSTSNDQNINDHANVNDHVNVNVNVNDNDNDDLPTCQYGFQLLEKRLKNNGNTKLYTQVFGTGTCISNTMNSMGGVDGDGDDFMHAGTGTGMTYRAANQQGGDPEAEAVVMIDEEMEVDDGMGESKIETGENKDEWKKVSNLETD